ncbi:MAG TPA: hypothetical protein VGM56_05200 [Byssovorax sp.]|jgi:hypothetical protein
MLEAINLEAKDVFANLVPLVRSHAEVKQRGDASREKGRVGIPSIEFLGGTKIVLVVDTPDALVWVDTPLFEAIGLGASALDLATQNLRKRTQADLDLVPLRDDMPWAVRLATGDRLDTGRLLLHDLWRRPREAIDGELLVRLATRHTVLACSNRPEEVAFVDRLARTLAKDEGEVTDDFFAWTPTSWGEVELPPELRAQR